MPHLLTKPKRVDLRAPHLPACEPTTRVPFTLAVPPRDAGRFEAPEEALELTQFPAKIKPFPVARTSQDDPRPGSSPFFGKTAGSV